MASIHWLYAELARTCVARFYGDHGVRDGRDFRNADAEVSDPFA